MNAKKKCFLFHRWSEMVPHKLKLYNKKCGLHYEIVINEKVCLRCFILKAKLQK